MKTHNNDQNSTLNVDDVKCNRRRLMSLMLLGSGVLISSNRQWSKPLVDMVILPAHAQTSAMMCVTDTTVGGPLAGHPSGALSCQAACEAEATSQNAELCSVDEFVDGAGATQCDCDLDLQN